MDKIETLVNNNTREINEIQIKLARQDSTIQLMQKDYEYIKKSIDNIESNTLSNFNRLNKKLDEIQLVEIAAKEERLKHLDDTKKYITRAILTIMATGAFLYLFPFFK